MAGPEPIEAEFVARAKAIVGLREALDHDPERVPAMPHVTLAFVGVSEQLDKYTGPATENEWSWRLRLRVPLKSRQGSDYKRYQEEIAAFLPPLFKIVRDDPSLGDTCFNARLVDPGEEAELDHDQKRATKELLLFARTEEV